MKEYSEEVLQKVKELNEAGKSMRFIARETGLLKDNIPTALSILGVEFAGYTRPRLTLDEEDYGICSKCGERKHKSEFQLMRRGKINEYRLTYCRRCRTNQIRVSSLRNINIFLKKRCYDIKRRALKNNIPFNLDEDYLLEIYYKQNKRCFYCGEEFNIIDSGLKNNSLSIDKVSPDLGYIKGNVVLCLHRINSIKRDLTFEELQRWIPIWSMRVMACSWLDHALITKNPKWFQDRVKKAEELFNELYGNF